MTLENNNFFWFAVLSWGIQGFPGGWDDKESAAVQETQVRFVGQEDPLEEGMATHSTILAWKIPWTEEPGRLQSMGSQRVRYDWVTNTWNIHLSSLFTFPICSKCRTTIELINVEFFGNLCNYKRTSFDDVSQFVIVNSQWLVTTRLIFKALVSFAKPLEPPLHCTSVSCSWTKHVDAGS